MPALKFSAWLDPLNEASLSSFERHAGLLARIYPLWYGCGPAGLPLRRLGSESGRRRALDAAQACGVELWPLLGNFDFASGAFDPALLRLILGDASTRRAYVAALLQGAKEDGARGVDLHYENLYPSDREAFLGFVQELGAAFHAQGMQVALVLRAAVADQRGIWTPSPGDAAALADFCDRLQVLEWDPSVSAAQGPMSPPGRGAEALALCLAAVPAEKLEWGLPGFGRDWGADGTVLPLAWSDWDRLVAAYPPARRDPLSVELSLRHGARVAWMNDSISLTAKLWHLRQAGICAAALWALGDEDPRLWALLESLPPDFLPAASQG